MEKVTSTFAQWGAYPRLQQELWRAQDKGFETLTQVHLFYSQEIFSLQNEQLCRLLQANSKLRYLIFPSNEMNFNIFAWSLKIK